MHKPWLSLVMPTYNGARFLAKALESVLAQHDDELEIIAVDDGSTDATPAVLESYSRRLPMRIINRQHTGNWVASTNYAISIAQGDYISCLHQDDCWLAKRLGATKKVLAAHPDVTLLVHACWYIDDDGRPLGMLRCPLPASGSPLPGDVLFDRLVVQNFIAVAGAVFRREAALRVGGMDERLWYTADWDLWLKLASAGPVMYLPEALACCRVHGRSQTAQRTSAIDDYRAQLQIVRDRHLGRRMELAAVAQFSAAMNAWMAATFHGHRPAAANLLGRFLALGPFGWYRYVRDSRVVERALPRLRALTRARDAP